MPRVARSASDQGPRRPPCLGRSTGLGSAPRSTTWILDSVMRSWTRLVSRWASCASRSPTGGPPRRRRRQSRSSRPAEPARHRRLELGKRWSNDKSRLTSSTDKLSVCSRQSTDEAAAADGTAEQRHPNHEARRPAAEPGHRDLDSAFHDLAVPAHLAGQRGELTFDHQAIAPAASPRTPGPRYSPQHSSLLSRRPRPEEESTEGRPQCPAAAWPAAGPPAAGNPGPGAGCRRNPCGPGSRKRTVCSRCGTGQARRP